MLAVPRAALRAVVTAVRSAGLWPSTESKVWRAWLPANRPASRCAPWISRKVFTTDSTRPSAALTGTALSSTCS